ncbi:isopenicillin N synthase family dioxygenase [Pseudomonas citronellolis]|uniref:isopenicillin N synthase family dioxygenase n=1 Tax=Pseudomonas citronellolis TaxID=53408 RepID=UPI0023E3C54B|nr:2OG-Fe(II) oxygenase family protein [Pseudomonas citronellolis]MDF3933464.1 2OG-Fe(II) oxygenase family protein [Pseudomonas citronellolis]
MDFYSFPVLGYGELVHDEQASRKLLNAFESCGYFYLSDLDALIPPPLFKSLSEVSGRFFASSLREKMAYYIGESTHHRGYVPSTEKGAYSDEKIRAYEAFDIGFDAPELPSSRRKGFELVGPNSYPPHVPGMEEVLSSYYCANFTIGRQILRLIARESGLAEDYFETYLTRPASQLRLIRYFPNDVLVNSDDASMGAHTDYELFTIMHQSSPGLVCYDRQRQCWQPMPVFKNTLLVLVGDMLQFLTNGQVKSLLHRVVTTGEERYSFPFFMNLDFETRLRALPCYGRCDETVVVGQHLLAQLYRDFPYIKRRIDSGEWAVDFPIPDFNKYEQV